MLSDYEKSRIFEFKLKMNYTLSKIFKYYLVYNENISIHNILIGFYDNGLSDITIFDINLSKFERLQKIQYKMMGGVNNENFKV